MSEAVLRFAYLDAGGSLTKRELTAWAEEGHYLKGFDLTSGGTRTFRKDRIAEYFDGAAAFLTSPLGIPPPRIRSAAPAPRDERHQIVFTGFAAVRRADLERQSDAAGLRVVKSVTQALVFLCAGPNAGPSKVAQARVQGVYIVREPELLAFLETGELPDYAVPDGA